MRHDINTPFGPAQIQFNGIDRVYLEFPQVKLGRTMCKGTVKLKKNDGRNFSSQKWLDETNCYNEYGDFRRLDKSGMIPAGAAKTVREEIVPWLRNHLENANYLFLTGRRTMLEQSIRFRDQDIADLEKKLQEKREERERLISELADLSTSV